MKNQKVLFIIIKRNRREFSLNESIPRRFLVAINKYIMVTEIKNGLMFTRKEKGYKPYRKIFRMK